MYGFTDVEQVSTHCAHKAEDMTVTTTINSLARGVGECFVDSHCTEAFRVPLLFNTQLPRVHMSAYRVPVRA